MSSTKINTIPGFIAYVRENSTWQISTIRNVIQALGYSTQGGIESLKTFQASWLLAPNAGRTSVSPVSLTIRIPSAFSNTTAKTL
jgi:hypothetical protein